MKFFSIVALLFSFALMISIPLPMKAEEEQQVRVCCFERAGYQGTCRVTPGEEETCQTILEYLNTAGTVGKSYCGASKLRGGWKQVECPKEEEKAKD